MCWPHDTVRFCLLAIVLIDTLGVLSMILCTFQTPLGVLIVLEQLAGFSFNNLVTTLKAPSTTTILFR